MEKLELKYLADYLPYDLKFIGYLKHGSSLPFDDSEDILTLCPFVLTYLHQEFEEFKPILRPLSDLTNKYGYHFIWERETDYESLCQWVDLDIDSRLTDKFSYEFWQILFENHFDLFGLIEKGLAVDINTIKQNK